MKRARQKRAEEGNEEEMGDGEGEGDGGVAVEGWIWADHDE